MSKQPTPAPTASAAGPCPTLIQISRTIAPPDHPVFIWKEFIELKKTWVQKLINTVK